MQKMSVNDMLGVCGIERVDLDADVIKSHFESIKRGAGKGLDSSEALRLAQVIGVLDAANELMLGGGITDKEIKQAQQFLKTLEQNAKGNLSVLYVYDQYAEGYEKSQSEDVIIAKAIGLTQHFDAARGDAGQEMIAGLVASQCKKSGLDELQTALTVDAFLSKTEKEGVTIDDLRDKNVFLERFNLAQHIAKNRSFEVDYTKEAIREGFDLQALSQLSDKEKAKHFFEQLDKKLEPISGEAEVKTWRQMMTEKLDANPKMGLVGMLTTAITCAVKCGASMVIEVMKEAFSISYGKETTEQVISPSFEKIKAMSRKSQDQEQEQKSIER